MCLGKHLKYSSCLYNTPRDTLDLAEANMLSLYCQRADLSDGQAVLELGCGWGSLSLFIAAAYPKSKVTSVSNSRTQREFIMAQAEQRGIKNLKVSDNGCMLSCHENHDLVSLCCSSPMLSSKDVLYHCPLTWISYLYLAAGHYRQYG